MYACYYNIVVLGRKMMNLLIQYLYQFTKTKVLEMIRLRKGCIFRVKVMTLGYLLVQNSYTVSSTIVQHQIIVSNLHHILPRCMLQDDYCV